MRLRREEAAEILGVEVRALLPGRMAVRLAVRLRYQLFSTSLIAASQGFYAAGASS